MSCIALCELIDHADVKSGDSGNSVLNMILCIISYMIFFIEDNARGLVADSMNGRVPIKYYLVTNSELVRVRYLLIYSQQVQTAR